MIYKTIPNIVQLLWEDETFPIRKMKPFQFVWSFPTPIHVPPKSTLPPPCATSPRFFILQLLRTAAAGQNPLRFLPVAITGQCSIL